MQNDKFIQQIKKISKKKLEEIKEQLSQQTEEKLRSLKKEVAQAKKQVEEEKEFAQQVQQARKNFNQFLDQKFQKQTDYEQQIEEIWRKVSQQYFSKKNNFDNWLEQELQAIKNMQGTVRAGDSINQVKKILGSDTSLAIQQDNLLGPGFILENDQVMIDATLENYLKTKLKQIKQELATII